MSQPAMTCSEAEPLLPLVADGAVDPDSEPALFAHLGSCPACQEAMARHDLVTLALERSSDRTRRRARPILRLWLATAAVLALAAGAATWMLLPHRQGESVITAPVAIATPEASTPIEPEVVRVIGQDGRATWMVRRDGRWIVIDPARVDGPAEPGRGGNSGSVPVRY